MSQIPAGRPRLSLLDSPKGAGSATSIRRGLPVIYLTDTLARQTAERLDSFVNRKPAESAVYWLGIELGGQAAVTTLIMADSLVAPEPSDVQGSSAVAGTPLVLLGMARCVPGSAVGPVAITGPSHGLAEGRLSIVIPHFGRHGFELEECGVYRQIGEELRRIPRSSLAAHLRILPGHADLRAVVPEEPREEIRNIAVW